MLEFVLSPITMLYYTKGKVSDIKRSCSRHVGQNVVMTHEVRFLIPPKPTQIYEPNSKQRLGKNLMFMVASWVWCVAI